MKRQFDQSLTLPPSPTAMPTQNFQNEQMDSPMELGAQERIERKGARPSETPTSVISGRPVVKARPASPPMIVLMVEGSGTVVFSALVSSSKDEMTMSGLYVIDVIDWIDVVATLVPEEDVWQFEATEVRMTQGKKNLVKMGGNAKGSKQPSSTVSVVCHGSEHRRIEIGHVCGNLTFEIRATDSDLGSELQAQASKRVDDHCRVRHFRWRCKLN